jgi:hypothetical protein
MKKMTGNTVSLIAILAIGGAALFAGVADARSPAGGAGMGAGMGPGGGAAFAKIDANGDGKITPEEFKAFEDSRMATLDANGDGFVTQDELTAAAEARRAQAMAERQAQRFAMLLKRADTNGDGKLSTEELATFMNSRSRGPQVGENGLPRGWDLNGDGVVTQDEFQTAMAAMMKHRQGMHGDGHGRGDGHGGGFGRGDGHGWRGQF